MADSPAVIAQTMLNELHDMVSERSTPPPDVLAQVGLLAAAVEIADRLRGIEASLDLLRGNLDG